MKTLAIDMELVIASRIIITIDISSHTIGRTILDMEITTTGRIIIGRIGGGGGAGDQPTAPQQILLNLLVLRVRSSIDIA